MKTKRNLKTSKAATKANSFGTYGGERVFQFSESREVSRPNSDYLGGSKKIKLNGKDNSVFDYIHKCYKGSPTNQSIIDKAISYTHGKGLFNKIDGKQIKNFIDPEDWDLLCADFKKYGNCALFVIWESVGDGAAAQMKPIKVKYEPIRRFGLEVDEYGQEVGVYYCWDWKKKTQYIPKKMHVFDGSYKGRVDVENTTDENGIQTDVEVLLIRRPTDEDYFSTCDYDSALEYAEVEISLKDWTCSHIENGFQIGTIINANNGVPAPEIRKKLAQNLVNTVKGVNNARGIMVAFNENKEQEITITHLPNEGVNEQYVKFDDNAEEKLIKAHGIPPILCVATREGGGLGNNADEIRTATQSYYQSKILAYRKTLLNGLNKVAEYVHGAEKMELVILDFKDPFEEPKEETEVITVTQ